MVLNNGCTPDDMAGSLTSSAHDGSPVHDSSLFQAGLRKLGDALLRNKALKFLYLGANRIGDRGALILANVLTKSDSIEELSIEHNGITETGTRHIAEALAVNNGVRKLYCSGNRVGNDGAALFGTVLRENVAIEHLYLEHTGITDEGGHALAEGLDQNVAVKSIALRGNTIGPTEMAHIDMLLTTDRRSALPWLEHQETKAQRAERETIEREKLMEVSTESGSRLAKFPGMQKVALAVVRHIQIREREAAAATKDGHPAAATPALAAYKAAAADVAELWRRDAVEKGEEEDDEEDDDEEDTAAGGAHKPFNLHQLHTAVGDNVNVGADAYADDPVVLFASQPLDMANAAALDAECANADPGLPGYCHRETCTGAHNPVATDTPAPGVPDASVPASVSEADESAHGVLPESIGLPPGVHFKMAANPLKKCPFKTPAGFRK